jgi:subtilisin family serine protease
MKYTLAALRCRLAPSALGGLLLLAACGGGAPDDGGPRAEQAQSTGVPAAALPTDIIVQLKPGFAIEPILHSHGLTQVDRFGQRPIYRLRAGAGEAPEAVVAALQGRTEVRFAELNREIEAPEARRSSVWAIGGDAGSYGGQVAGPLIGLAAAHALSQGQGVRVAILDTGADLQHPALWTRWLRDAHGAVVGRDFVDDDGEPAEAGSKADAGYGHGTHVAGLVAMVAPAARLMPVRVLDRRGAGNAWVLAEALAWALDPDGNPQTDDGAHVVNLSLGTTTPTALLKKLTEIATCEFDDDDDAEAFAEDVQRCNSGQRAVVLAAAGNGGSETEVIYPAGEQVKGSLAITASTAARRLAPFANWGSWIGLAAPGEAIVSTVPGGGYGSWSGTSMATPLAAGTAALVLATLPKDGDPTRPHPRQWRGEEVIKRMTDYPVKLCGTSQLQLHAGGAVAAQSVPDPSCS